MNDQLLINEVLTPEQFNDVKLLHSDGRKYTALEWSKILGLNIDTLRWRFNHGWSVDAMLTTADRTRKGATRAGAR